MDDRFNTAAGWVLFSGIVALGLSSLSMRAFESETPEKPGYPIEAAEGGGGGASGPSMEEALNTPGVDAAMGERLFAKCAACHTATSGGANGIGPNLFGVMGQPVGKHVAGFAYSSALSGHGGTWDWATMYEWLKNPKAFAPGTKMSFAGMSKPEDRAAVMLYLNSMGGSLAVPAYTPAAEGAPAEGAPAEGAAAAGAAAEGGAAAPADGAAAPAATPAATPAASAPAAN